MSPGPDISIARLRSLDVLRGVAALLVVLWHWQHLWVLGTDDLIVKNETIVDRTTEPFYVWLRLAYDHGYIAVNMFFVISGFIFFQLYHDRIAAKRIRSVEFGLLRFSRLYPLQLATLLAVAGLQFVFHNLAGQFFVYPSNDWPHFVAALFFVQGTNKQSAFNGPAWSLTIEIAMYAAFFLLARLGTFKNWLGILLVFLAGLPLFWFNDSIADSIGQGLVGFFGGGLASRFVTRVSGSGWARGVLAVLGLLMFAGWAAVIFLVYNPDQASRLASMLPVARNMAPRLAVTGVLFPLTVATLALHETIFRFRYAGLHWLGDISYSSYLLHFPLQLGMAILVYAQVLSIAAVHSPWALAAFFAVLLPLSAWTYVFVEAPAQKGLRRLFFGRKRRASA
jgi:peptidoglycan/LPS O-acetylase OafA/YrhL